MNAIKRTVGFINGHPLAKYNLVSAYTRFIGWQIYTLFYHKPVAVPFIEPVKILAQKGLTGVTGNIYTGLHEFEDMSFLLHFLTEKDLFFDVGANVGSYTILASGVKKCHTISFEPGLKAFDFLKRNIKLNHLNDLVDPVNKGLGSEQAKLRFTSGEDTTNHIIADGEKCDQIVEIEIDCLDNYSVDRKPLLMKIDVEGFEKEVLDGAKNTLSDLTCKALIIELNGSGSRYNYNEDLIHETLLAYAFRPYSYDPFSRKLEARPSYSDKNTIYVRDLDFVAARLASASSYKVFNRMI